MAISCIAKYLRKLRSLTFCQSRNFQNTALFRLAICPHGYGTQVHGSGTQTLAPSTRSLLALVRIPTGRRQTSWLFTSVAEDLNSGLPRNKSRYWPARDSNTGPPDSDTLTTRLRCLLPCQVFSNNPTFKCSSPPIHPYTF